MNKIIAIKKHYAFDKNPKKRTHYYRVTFANGQAAFLPWKNHLGLLYVIRKPFFIQTTDEKNFDTAPFLFASKNACLAYKRNTQKQMRHFF